MTTDKTDIELWEDLKSGDEAAFSEIYNRHVQAMYRYGMSLMPISEPLILDSIHDIFTNIWLKREFITIPANVRFYLLRSVKNKLLVVVERSRRESPFSANLFKNRDFEPSVEENFVFNEDIVLKKRLIQKLLSYLPPRQQEALRLRYIENLNYNEIGQLLEINGQSAQNLIQRALQKIRQFLPKTH